MRKFTLIKNGNIAIFFLVAFQLASARGDQSPQFTQPIKCILDKDCFIQSYVDVDPTPLTHDYRCGANTYDGHDGIDFRVPSVDAALPGIPVLAAASGIVKGARDGVEDVLINEVNRKNVTGHECGNGVVIDHGDGWESQYCHMRKGSVKVKIGDELKAGQSLGLVGYSGLAQFAHLHFAVRHNGSKIDPFAGHGMDGACSTSEVNGSTLWADTDKKSLVYHPGQMFDLGFSATIPELTTLEVSSPPTPSLLSPALIFYARFMNLQIGDRIHLTLDGPTGSIADSISKPLSRNKAVFLAFTGKRRRLGPWPEGIYKGVAAIQRGGEMVQRHELSIRMDNISR